ncbi:DUF1000-domain-containing protein [Rozella allomycis CSF55]|uniref:DUF1000-domain-containing protein n=1 Tax=Rozella allomycis (strain CSF55) TaxID=988480 RepID=A0A075ARI4_ROZAC|nr:PITH domain-containing protein [Rozella allomycis CSF55]RKP20990.1 DUF1000-domain-containing protein [Rozella allomycis CSF55]|eukprot:EPZ31107.1 PITH domain-containing protein [Rozella allomycis CSF55]
MCNCSHSHSSIEEDLNSQYSLFAHVDVANVTSLNCTAESNAAKIFRPYCERLSKRYFVESDVDSQIILRIPFTGSIKIRSISVFSEGGDESPSLCKAFVNMDVDFDNVMQVEPTQEFEMARQEYEECAEYVTKVSKFSNVQTLTLFFEDNFGGEKTRIYFIGFKGEYTPMKREAVVAIYEAKPMLSDHKNEIEEKSHNIIQ